MIASPPSDPYELFAAWLDDAERSDAVRYANAVCLSTVDDAGRPDARTLLLMHFDAEGFVVFTDGESTKAAQVERVPEAALTFYWGPLDRQVRVRGPVEIASGAVADACFEERPRRSRLTAWASLQSRPMTSREALEARYASFEERFADDDVVTRPPHWRAYRVASREIEFWQARSCRLHDRVLYTRRGDGGWEIGWLEP